MVDFDSRLNSLRVNRDSRLDLPTPESPISTTVCVCMCECVCMCVYVCVCVHVCACMCVCVCVCVYVCMCVRVCVCVHENVCTINAHGSIHLSIYHNSTRGHMTHKTLGGMFHTIPVPQTTRQAWIPTVCGHTLLSFPLSTSTYSMMGSW